MKKKSQRRPTRKHAKSPEPTQAIVKAQQQEQLVSIPEAIEKVLILGDLASLTPQDRVDYYKRVCTSLGLNPLTMPFSYILFREYDGGTAKLSLYANKSCTEQLRKIHGVSVVPPLRRSRTADIVTVEADVRDKSGRTDSASGSVPLYKIKDGRRIDFDGKDLCNAEMKCETKAKRRATLSICGLAFLDESELDTMEIVGGVTPDGRIYQYQNAAKPELTEEAIDSINALKAKGLWCDEHNCTRNAKHVEQCESSRRAMQPAIDVPKAPQGQPEPQSGPIQEAPKSKASKKAETPVNPDVPKAAPLPPMPEQKTKYDVELDWTNPKSPILRGQIGDLLPMFQKHLHMTWEGEWWHIQPEDAKTLFEMAGPFMFRITETQPGQVSSAGQQRSAPPAQGKPQARGGAATISAVPAVVSGIIQRITAPTTAKGQPMRQVTILVDGKKPTFGCFQAKLFVYLDAAKGAIEALTTTNGKYLNLVGLKRIVTTKGVVDFDDDGITPVVQQNREAGTPPSLFND